MEQYTKILQLYYYSIGATWYKGGTNHTENM